MELLNLQEYPVAATMIGRGDRVFYREKDKDDYLEAVISHVPSLKFDQTPKYTIMFTSDSKKYKIGDEIPATRSQLNIEKKIADGAIDAFMLLL